VCGSSRIAALFGKNGVRERPARQPGSSGGQGGDKVAERVMSAFSAALLLAYRCGTDNRSWLMAGRSALCSRAVTAGEMVPIRAAAP
jgi:hypothetical protein